MKKLTDGEKVEKLEEIMKKLRSPDGWSGGRRGGLWGKEAAVQHPAEDHAQQQDVAAEVQPHQ